MCGRYTIRIDWRRVHDLYRLTVPVEPAPEGVQARYNAAPGQRLPVVGENGARRSVIASRWGLIPPWVGALSEIKISTINARAETLDGSRLYAEPWRRRRCLVPADGWYEWSAPASGEKVKPVHFIERPESRPFAFAGLWGLWRDGDGKAIVSHTIVTTEAVPELAPLHPRMPVVLDTADFDAWLRAEEPPRDLLRDHPGPWHFHRVDNRVGKVSEDDPGLVTALAPAS